ncbi:MAG: hypothetical protein JW705_07450 [Methanosarcinaceae archaeon]|nr:hypothetical protein [Methanosarcinaceae archaeon]
MNEKIVISCEHCNKELKRQLLGSNVFYYCKCCGRITSAKDMVIGLKKERVGKCV